MRHPLATVLALAACATLKAAAPGQSPAPAWPWDPELDAVVAAPASHHVLLENERVRVLEVVVPPGAKEPVHTHRWPSVFYITDPSWLRYYPVLSVDGRLVAGAPSGGKLAGDPPKGPQPPFWLGPEGPHAVENVGPRAFRAIRVEIKDAPAIAVR
jgi:hypothetical protein